MSAKNKIYQYSLSGKFIKEYNSMADVCKENPGFARSNICDVVKGRKGYSYGYQWRAEFLPHLPEITPKRGNKKLFGELIYSDRTDYIKSSNKTSLMNLFREFVDEPGIQLFQIKEDNKVIFKADIQNGQLHHISI